MEWIKNILINYWPQILAVLFFIASFILQCFKKKPVSDILALCFDWSIEGIKIAENTNVKGDEKLALAVQYVFKRMKLNFPELNVEVYRSVIIGIIETILSTPQKHEG